MHNIYHATDTGRAPKDLGSFVGGKWTGLEGEEYGGILTYDGEHLNRAGIDLLLQVLVPQVGSAVCMAVC